MPVLEVHCKRDYKEMAYKAVGTGKPNSAKPM